MLSLVLAALFFFAVHIFVPGTGARAALVARLGEKGYLAFFSVVSVVGLVWLGMAYGAASADPMVLWGEVPGARPLVIAAMLPIVVLALAGLTSPSPTSVGQEGLLKAGEPAQGVLRISRHPFMSSVAAWSLLHLTVNGDVASLILFGTLAALAIYGMAVIDRRRAATGGADWERFAAKTSRTPFLAILQGRNRLALGEIGVIRLVGGVVLWYALLHGHTWIAGVPATLW
jgi:uncharacterized membrane protein